MLVFVSLSGQEKRAPKKRSKAKAISIKKEKTFRVDFREKDIHDFLKAMSAIIGKNIIADEKVRGKITVISPERIPVAQALSYLTSVLAVKGLGVVISDKLLRVITLKDAVAKGSIIHIGKKNLPKDVLRADGPVTAILHLDYIDPIRLSGVLKRVTNTQTEIVDYKEIGHLILTGGALEVDRLIKIIIEVDKPLEIEEEEEEALPHGQIHIIRLNNMEADKVAATLNQIRLSDTIFSSKSGQVKKSTNTKSTRKQGEKIHVIPHVESNSLIYVGTQEEWKVVKSLIRSIDITREQVLLEVFIAEVQEGDLNDFGIDWRFQNGGIGQFGSGTAGAAVASSLAANPGQGVATALSNGLNTILGLSLGVIIDQQAKVLALFNANINKENFVILSAPKILTLNNQEAEINVGEDYPVRLGSRTSGATDATIETFDYRPIGVNIKFTPQINSAKEVTIKLYQEVKSVVNTDDVTVNPRFTKRDIRTTIKVKNKQTIVLGGLISTRRTETSREIPILADIPLLGFLFRRRTTNLVRSNLLVFITPHILTNSRIADQVTEQLRQEQLKVLRGTK